MYLPILKQDYFPNFLGPCGSCHDLEICSRANDRPSCWGQHRSLVWTADKICQHFSSSRSLISSIDLSGSIKWGMKIIYNSDHNYEIYRLMDIHGKNKNKFNFEVFYNKSIKSYQSTVKKGYLLVNCLTKLNLQCITVFFASDWCITLSKKPKSNKILYDHLEEDCACS